MCAALPPLCIDSTLARHPRGGHPGTHNVPAIRPPAGKAEGEAPVTPPGMEQLHPRTHLPMSLYASDPSAGGSGGSSAGGDPGGDQAGAQRASWRSWWRGRGRQAQQGEGPPAQQQQQQQQGLSTTRAMSSIPMTGPMPHHQQSAYVSKPAAPTSTQQQGPAGPQAAIPQTSPQGGRGSIVM